MITNALFPMQFLIGGIGAKTISMSDFGIVSVVVDAMVTENHSYTAQMTEYPIEDGSEISDHVVQKPDSLTINGVISNSPIYIGPGFLSFNRVMDGYTSLWAMKTAGLPVDIVTGIKIYQKMIIESFVIDRNAQNGQALEFTMQCREAKIVKSQSGSIGVKIAMPKVLAGQPVTYTDPSALALKYLRLQGFAGSF